MGVFNRRSFISLSVGGTVGILFTPLPWKIADDISIWTQNWPWIPKLQYGDKQPVSTVSKLCPSGCAVNVSMVGNRPTTVVGNPDNELSQGGVCPLCASAMQMAYSPARVTGPMKKSGSGFAPISWDEAVDTLAAKLKPLAGKDGKVLAISGDADGTSSEVFAALTKALGSSSFFIMPGDKQTSAAAWKAMDGKGQIGFDIAGADCVLFAGADALQSWGPTVFNQKSFGASKANYAYAGPTLNKTAAVCKAWVPVAPGGNAAFLMGLAAELIKLGKSVDSPDFEEFKSLAMGFSPAKVEQAAGVKADSLTMLAKKLASAGKPLVVVGSDFGQGAGAAAMMAGYAVNLLLGNLNADGGMRAVPVAPQALSSAPSYDEIMAADLVGYLAKLEKGKVTTPDVLITYEANPAYGLPQADATAQVLGKIPFKVSFATYMDETAAMADLILPNLQTMERTDDIVTPHGLPFAAMAVGAPVMNPAVDAMDARDVALKAASKAGLDLGAESFEDVLKAKAQALGASFDDLANGAAFVSKDTVSQDGLTLGARLLAKAVQPYRDNSYPLAMAPQMELNIGTADIATPPSNLTTIPDTQLKGKMLYVAMCKETAGKVGVAEGSKVKVTGRRGEITALVHIDERVMPGVVSAPLGLGRTAWDVFTKGKGANVFKVLSVDTEPGTGLTVWTGSKVKVAKS